jgi:hypothetical protein
MVFHH